MNDRSWMYQRLKDGYINLEFVGGVNKFIEHAFLHVESGGTIRCPCFMCKNRKFQVKEEVSKHLLLKGFVPLYSTWIFHGEEEVGESVMSGLESNSRVIEEKRKVKCASISTCEFIDNKSREVYETHIKKKAKLQEDENVWSPRLWMESSGGFTRGRVYGAPYIDTSTILNKSSQSNLLADRVNQEQSIMSAGMTLTADVKSIVEREVQLAISNLFGSIKYNSLQSTNQQAWMDKQPSNQTSQPIGQPSAQPPSQIMQPSTYPFSAPAQPLSNQPSQVPQPPTQLLQHPPSQIQLPHSRSFAQPSSFLSQPPYHVPQPCDQPFPQHPNYISQPSCQSSQSFYQLTQPSTACQQPLERCQTMNTPLQITFGNSSQQVGSFMQLLRPITQNGFDLNQSGNYEASTENHPFQNEGNT